jgi:hypothetical protein
MGDVNVNLGVNFLAFGFPDASIRSRAFFFTFLALDTGLVYSPRRSWESHKESGHGRM